MLYRYHTYRRRYILQFPVQEVPTLLACVSSYCTSCNSTIYYHQYTLSTTIYSTTTSEQVLLSTCTRTPPPPTQYRYLYQPGRGYLGMYGGTYLAGLPTTPSLGAVQTVQVGKYYTSQAPVLKHETPE